MKKMTPYQIKALLKAKRVTRLMKLGYSLRSGDGEIYEVNPYGKPLNAIEMALLEGISEQELFSLLEEREKRAKEWLAKKQSEEDSQEKKESTEAVD